MSDFLINFVSSKKETLLLNCITSTESELSDFIADKELVK